MSSQAYSHPKAGLTLEIGLLTPSLPQPNTRTNRRPSWIFTKFFILLKTINIFKGNVSAHLDLG